MFEDRSRSLLELLMNVSREVATALTFARSYSVCSMRLFNMWAENAAALW
ncbi:hypothetical protein [Candidatus Villigracilis saccharophilus]|nr:hypothetical protein [Anaerolineales bacterium]